MKWIDAKMKVSVQPVWILFCVKLDPRVLYPSLPKGGSVSQFNLRYLGLMGDRSDTTLFVYLYVGVGSDRQPKLQDNVHVGQRSHDHSTHPKERGGGGWYTNSQTIILK